MKKVLLSSVLSATLLLTGCQGTNQKNIDKETMIEYLYFNSYDNKNFIPNTLTQYELENINNILLNISESNIYKENGNIPLYKYYISQDPKNINKENKEQIFYYNSLNYNELINDNTSTTKLYAKISETQLSDYFTAGIKTYSLDKNFKEDSKLLLSFPYLRVNPRLPIESILIQGNNENNTLLFMTVTMDLSNLTKIEIEALKEVAKNESLEVIVKDNKLIANMLLHNRPYLDEIKNG